MARNSKTSTSGSSEHEVDLLARYRRRVKRAFRSGKAAQGAGTAVANPGVTKVERARQARHPGSKPSEGENS